MPHVISGYLDMGTVTTKMKAYAVDLTAGNYLGAESEINPDSGYYYLELTEPKVDVLVMVAQSMTEWVAGTELTIGDLGFTSDLDDLVLKVIQAGTTGTAEPTGFTLGERVTDGTVEYEVVQHLRPQALQLKNTVEV